ncbi:MAG: DUF2809 domain-containing protein [Maledivibacter sp.]|jgi:hypothetical protein|nr:DUF2809 domain-containing protein [Maledivibacter sp.]
MVFERKRVAYFIYTIVVIILGLSSRHFSNTLPKFLAVYSGDILWGLMIFLLLGFIFKKKSSINIAVIGAVISISIEISQLYHSPWIDGIRKTTIGGLVLGYGFLWSDIVCYIVGIAIGFIFEIFLRINNFKV